MNRTIGKTHGENHDKAVCNDAIRRIVRKHIPAGQESWHANYVFGVPESLLSCYLNGTRSFPAWLIPVCEAAFQTHELTECLKSFADASGVSASGDTISAEELSLSLPDIIREAAHVQSDIAQFISDKHLDDLGKRHLSDHLLAQARYYQTLSDGLSRGL